MTGIRFSVRDMTLMAMMTALIAVCAWVTVPMTIPFTMQTFGMFMALKLLGGKRGTVTILLYILLGAAGAPVFSGFRGGISVLAGPTGGYIAGFLLGGGLYWVTEKWRTNGKRDLAVLLGSLLVCYGFGTVWFMTVMGNRGTPMGLFQALGLCVVPYILPDLIKLVLAERISGRLRKALKI